MNKQFLKGTLVGVIAPIAALFVFIAFSFEPDGFKGFAEKIMEFQNRNILTHVISLSVIINLAIFFMKLKTKRDQAAKGVLFATLLYAFLVIFLKIKIFLG